MPRITVNGSFKKNKNGRLFVQTEANPQMVVGRTVVVYRTTDRDISDIVSGRKIGSYEELLGVGYVVSSNEKGVTVELKTKPTRSRINGMGTSQSRRFTTYPSTKRTKGKCLVRVAD